MFNPILQRDKVIKTFVFEKQDTQQSTITDYELDLMPQLIDLSPILMVHCPLSENRVSIYDPSTCKFVWLARLGSENGCIPKYLFEPALIFLRFIEKGSLIIDYESYNSYGQGQEHSGDQKEGRSKERTIGEVLEIVKKWRDLHQYGHSTLRRRLNLQDAAKLVGISKKSLDDYYCQLRLGQLYHFNYVENLHEKMGILRTYVKNYRPERQQSKRRQNDKHPKNLKILRYYDLASHDLKNVEQLMKEQEYAVLNHPQQMIPEQMNSMQAEMKQEKINIVDSLQPLSSFMIQEAPVSKQLFNLQHEFFKGFQVPLEEEADPYYSQLGESRRREMDLDSNSFMFLD